MNGMTLAARTFQRAVAKVRETFDAGEDYCRFPGERLVELIEREIVPQLARLCEHVSFQRLALYPFSALLPESATPERRQITQLKVEIRNSIEVFTEFLNQHDSLIRELVSRADVRKKLRLSPPPDTLQGKIVSSVVIGAGPERPVQRSSDSRADRTEGRPDLYIDLLRGYLVSAENDCSREWVSGEDYFCPTHETFLGVGEDVLQRAELITSLNPALEQVGNTMARCLLVRAESPIRGLELVGRELQRQAVAANVRLEQPWHAATQQLRSEFASLCEACLSSNQAELVESAIILVQVYAGFVPGTPALCWLPPAAWPCEANQHVLRHNLTHRRDRHTAERIAWALDKIASWCNQRASDETALEEAVATGGLVIDERTMSVYWEGKQIAPQLADSHMQWRLLWCLAHSRGQALVDEYDVYDLKKNRTLSAFPNLKRNLCGNLPASLRARIKSGSEPRTYRLDLPAGQIHTFARSPSA